MLWGKKSEIEKIIKKYGQEKGNQFLSHYCTLVRTSAEIKARGESIEDFTYGFFAVVLENRGKTFFHEFMEFVKETHGNSNLISEIRNAEEKYFDPSLLLPRSSKAKAVNSENRAGVYNTYEPQQDPKEFLEKAAFETFQKNKFLNKDGSVPNIVSDYSSNDFIKECLKYCKSHYAEKGNKKILSECIITSFYGAICMIVYSKKRAPFYGSNEFPFYRLREYIDLEYTDVAAEHLLGTKKGESLAESIWSLFSDYLNACMSMFNTKSSVDDDIILAAMKHAHTIGKVVGDFYSSGDNQKCLSLFVEEDVLKIDSPNDLDALEGKYSVVPVKIFGTLSQRSNTMVLSMNDLRSGDATIQVNVLGLAEKSALSSRLNQERYVDVALYGKLICKGRWDSKLINAFQMFTPENARTIKCDY